jgi:hypothetical protein
MAAHPLFGGGGLEVQSAHGTLRTYAEGFTWIEAKGTFEVPFDSVQCVTFPGLIEFMHVRGLYDPIWCQVTYTGATATAVAPTLNGATATGVAPTLNGEIRLVLPKTVHCLLLPFLCHVATFNGELARP